MQNPQFCLIRRLPRRRFARLLVLLPRRPSPSEPGRFLFPLVLPRAGLSCTVEPAIVQSSIVKLSSIVTVLIVKFPDLIIASFAVLNY